MEAVRILLKTGGKRMSRLLLFVTGSISIGYLVHIVLYYHEMHALVDMNDDACSGIDLIIILAVVGFVLYFF